MRKSYTKFCLISTVLQISFVYLWLGSGLFKLWNHFYNPNR